MRTSLVNLLAIVPWLCFMLSFIWLRVSTQRHDFITVGTDSSVSGGVKTEDNSRLPLSGSKLLVFPYLAVPHLDI